MFAKTYRFRLIFYSALLVIFLSATLIYSYKHTNDVVLNEVKNNLDRTVQLFNSQLISERSELKRFSNIVSDDLRIQEYMFVVVRVGSDSKPLVKLYERLFGWLPIDRKVIVSDNGEVLIGSKHTDLTTWVNKHKRQVMGNVYYIESTNGLELVSISPIIYQEDKLGFVALTRRIDENWLQAHKQSSNEHLFLTKNGQILISTLTHTDTKEFKLQDNKLSINEEIFITYPIALPKIEKNSPLLWFAISETQLINTLNNHGQITLTLIATSSVVILWLGILIFRNFSKPITELMIITREVSEGRLPRMEKSEAQNEIGVLANNFADMLQVLREKQAEIDRVHKRLEMSSITDTLTGMFNRRHLQEIFPKLCAQARREWRNISVIILDLDHFKKINDDYGHLAGDQVLINFSDILKKHLRLNDFLFRLGGEEFLLISINKNIEASISIADKVRLATEKSIVTYNGIDMALTVSCGISSIKPGDHDTSALLPILLTQADKALYEAKNLGRNRVFVHDDTTGHGVDAIQINNTSNI
ncbi:MAG: diguanylate cyclase [Gammaproteobacteria bacterium]|nr:diguanylate cyclase [Gammaproteobacteria bacterium]